jgi:hypothetical protein
MKTDLYLTPERKRSDCRIILVRARKVESILVVLALWISSHSPFVSFVSSSSSFPPFGSVDLVHFFFAWHAAVAWASPHKPCCY